MLKVFQDMFPLFLPALSYSMLMSSHEKIPLLTSILDFVNPKMLSSLYILYCLEIVLFPTTQGLPSLDEAWAPMVTNGS